MIADPEDYFRGFVPRRDELLLELEQEAELEKIPIIGPIMGELLYILVRATGAQKVLELGTATGYSTIYLARGIESKDRHLLSLEHDPDLAQRARTNLERAGAGEGVEVRVADALGHMKVLQGPFDFIFMDIDKEGYREVLPECRRLLRVGGLLVTDNVGFSSSRTFNQEIFDQEEWKTLHLYSFLPGHSPEKDGWSIALKNR
jgi:caffeoyl-CoA O-methyltransferase